MSEESLGPYRESRQTVEWARPKHERRLFTRAIFIIGCCPLGGARLFPGGPLLTQAAPRFSPAFRKQRFAERDW